jgi:hypothetical protein
LQAVKAKIGKISGLKPSVRIRRTIFRTATTGKLNAIHAKPLAAKFPCIKAAAVFACDGLSWTGGFGSHDVSTKKYAKTN